MFYDALPEGLGLASGLGLGLASGLGLGLASGLGLGLASGDGLAPESDELADGDASGLGLTPPIRCRSLTGWNPRLPHGSAD